MTGNRTNRWTSSEKPPLFDSAATTAGWELTTWRSHHVLTLLIDGKLFLAPLETDKIQVGDTNSLVLILRFLISLLILTHARKSLTLEREPVLGSLTL